MLRWFLIEFTVLKTVSAGTSQLSTCRFKELKLIQAQTEEEAVAKYKMTLKKGKGEYQHHENKTIL